MMDQILLDGRSKKWDFSPRDNWKKNQKILKTKIKLIGSGRTDKGVHAKAQSANFLQQRK